MVSAEKTSPMCIFPVDSRPTYAAMCVYGEGIGPAGRGISQMSKTPGYNIRLTIKIAADKNSRTRATYWSMRAMCWLPIKIADAELFLATEQADRAA